VFGWFLQPGKLYELFTGEEEEGAAGKEAAQEAGEAAAAAGQLPAPAHRQQQQQEAEGGLEERPVEEGPMDASQCKLGQRLLARLAAQQQGKGKQQRGRPAAG